MIRTTYGTQPFRCSSSIDSSPRHRSQGESNSPAKTVKSECALGLKFLVVVNILPGRDGTLVDVQNDQLVDCTTFDPIVGTDTHDSNSPIFPRKQLRDHTLGPRITRAVFVSNDDHIALLEWRRISNPLGTSGQGW
jgi:hypothetical protein